MLHLAAEAVKMERAETCYPDPGSQFLTTDLFGRSLARTYIDFADLSATGTFGDPGLASAGKGARIFAICVDELARFLADFAQWPIPPAGSGPPE